MVTLVILSEGVDEADHPAMMMKDVTAPCGRVLSFLCRGKLAYTQPNIEVRVTSCEPDAFALQSKLLDPVREHRPFTRQQLEIVRYHLNCIGISCRII